MQWDLLGIYVVGISLESYDSRLHIGCVDEVRFTWYTFGGMDSWMRLALAMGVTSDMDILTTIDTCDYLWIKFFVLGIFSWYRIL